MGREKKQLSKKAKMFIYVMIACQILAWTWFSTQGGKVSDTSFLIFTMGMLLGQTGTSVETFVNKAWGTFAVQVWFFIFTLYGGIVRFLQM